MTDDELQKQRADYAWKWFDLHAKQRMTLFNYFLIIAGIFANVVFLAYKEESAAISAAALMNATNPAQLVTSIPAIRMHTFRQAVGLLGAVASIAFIVFDIRTRSLTTRSELVLEHLERSLLFPDGYVFSSIGSGEQLGILRTGRAPKKPAGWWWKLWRSLFWERIWANVQKMKYWIWLIESMVAVGFILSIVL